MTEHTATETAAIEAALPELEDAVQQRAWVASRDKSFGEVPVVRFELTNLSFGSGKSAANERLALYSHQFQRRWNTY